MWAGPLWVLVVISAGESVVGWATLNNFRGFESQGLCLIVWCLRKWPRTEEPHKEDSCWHGV